MQQQNQVQREPSQEALSEEEKQAIIRSIKQTYSGGSTNSVKQSQQLVLGRLQNNFKVIELLFEFIKPPYQFELNFRVSCGNFIKKALYRISESDVNKRPYIKLGYDILVATNYRDHRIKQNVSVGFEYIFNKDELSLYKDDCMNYAKMQLQSLIGQPEAWTIQTIEVIHGLMLIFISYLNSLVQPEDQAQFLNDMLTTFCRTASLCAKFAQHNIMQSVNPCLLFLAPNQIFTFFQLATERLLQQQQLIPDEVSKFIDNESFINGMIQYLYLYCEQNSIVTKYPNLNEIKVQILQILYLFNQHECHINRTFIQLIFICFRSQAVNKREDDDEDDAIQSIICKCMSILQNQMRSQNHMDFFLQNKIQIVFDLFMYSRSGPQEIQNMVQQPQKFVQMAQQYTEAFTASPIIKIRAANFIRAFVARVDEGLCNLVELCILFITGSLPITESNSQIVNEMRQFSSTFQFAKLQDRQKLDVCFMVLATIADCMKNREDLKVVISSVIITNFNIFCKITDELVLLRLIRLIGYYPSALYFSFIEQCMGYSRVFTLEGLSCFERVSRNKKYLTIFPMIHLAYQTIAEYISVDDPIFERLINQNYESILKKSEALFSKMLQKIYTAFQQAIQNLQEGSGSKQKSIICLNYIQKMIKMQKSQKNLAMLEQVEQQMENIGINIELLEQNFISIYQSLISKQTIVNTRVQQFVAIFSDPRRVHHYPNYSQFFKLLNKFIIKSDCFQVVQLVYNNLVNYLAETGKDEFNYAIIPQLNHCIGHMLIAYLDLPVSTDFLDFLVEVALRKENKQSRLGRCQKWYVFLILHLMFKKPATFREHLLAKNKYYAFMICLFQTKFDCKIERKAAVLAAVQLLVYEPQIQPRIQIIRFCITQLKIQIQKYLYKRKQKKRIQKHAQFKNQYQIGDEIMFERERKQHSQQQRMENEENKQLDQDSFLFFQFKHPFDNSCEFSMFKHRIFAFISNPQTANEINQKTLPQITEILQYQWHKNQVRKVVKIFK